MGLNYSFEIWVPREELFEALSVVTGRLPEENSHALAPLIWPDGRRLPLLGPAQQNPSLDVVPADASLDRRSNFCLCFGFEPDDALRDFDEESSYLRSDGLCWVGGIDLFLNLQSDWLKDEQPLSLLRFTAVSTSMSRLFSASPHVKRYFVDLARSMGALSCHLDFETDQNELLFLDGQEMDLMLNNDWKRNHPRFLRQLMGAPLNADQRSLRLCYELEKGCSAHELIEVHLLTHHEDGGLRCAALSALRFVQEKESLPLLRRAVDDTDASVRAHVARLLYGWDVERELLQLLEDPQLEVRVAAAGALECKKDSPQAFSRLSEVLLSTPPLPQNLALINAAFNALFPSFRHPRHYRVELLEALSAQRDFPFPNAARERLEAFHRHQS